MAAGKVMAATRKRHPTHRRLGRRCYRSDAGSTVALVEFAKIMDRLQRDVTPQELAEAEAHLREPPQPRQPCLPFDRHQS